MEEMMKKIGFNEKEISFITELYEKLDDASKKELPEIKKTYFMENTEGSLESVVNSLRKMSEKNAVHIYSLHLFFLLYCLDTLKENYKKAGLSEELFYDIAKDITYKMHECRDVHNIIGTFVFPWFHHHFLKRLFALGRFQYIKGKFRAPSPYVYKDITINEGDDVYYIHIPSSGAMTEEMRLDSYKKAFEFFGKTHGGYCVFVCDSWLLYKENEKIFPENSNLMGFFKDFDIIVSTEPNEPFSNAWRVFNCDFNGDVSLLPQKTTLQKNYAAWLAQGKKVGGGYGVIVFDGEKIVNK